MGNRRRGQHGKTGTGRGVGRLQLRWPATLPSVKAIMASRLTVRSHLMLLPTASWKSWRRGIAQSCVMTTVGLGDLFDFAVFWPIILYVNSGFREKRRLHTVASLPDVW